MELRSHQPRRWSLRNFLDPVECQVLRNLEPGTHISKNEHAHLRVISARFAQLLNIPPDTMAKVASVSTCGSLTRAARRAFATGAVLVDAGGCYPTLLMHDIDDATGIPFSTRDEHLCVMGAEDSAILFTALPTHSESYFIRLDDHLREEKLRQANE